jgi:hypothetical protein
VRGRLVVPTGASAPGATGHTVIVEIRRGTTHPYDLDLTTAEVWREYVEAATAPRAGADGPLTGVVAVAG